MSGKLPAHHIINVDSSLQTCAWELAGVEMGATEDGVREGQGIAGDRDEREGFKGQQTKGFRAVTVGVIIAADMAVMFAAVERKVKA